MTGKEEGTIFTPKSFTAAWNRGQKNTPNNNPPFPHLQCITELWGVFHSQQSPVGAQALETWISQNRLPKIVVRAGPGTYIGRSNSPSQMNGPHHTEQQSRKKALLRENIQQIPECMVFSPLHRPISNRRQTIQSPHSLYLRKEVQQLTSAMRAARRRSRKEGVPGNSILSLFPSFLACSSRICPRMQNPWLGAQRNSSKSI